MDSIVILIGIRNSGKSNTVANFFGWGSTRHSKGVKTIQNSIGKEKVVAMWKNSSPQEKAEFDTVEKIKEEIYKRIKKCQYIGADIMLINFSIILNSQIQVVEDIITEPIKELQTKYSVHTIFLDGGKPTNELNKARQFVVDKVKPNSTIISNEDYARQAKELESILRTLSV